MVEQLTEKINQLISQSNPPFVQRVPQYDNLADQQKVQQQWDYYSKNRSYDTRQRNLKNKIVNSTFYKKQLTSLLKDFAQGNESLKQTLQELKTQVNPFDNIATRQIKEIDPKFDWQQKLQLKQEQNDAIMKEVLTKTNGPKNYETVKNDALAFYNALKTEYPDEPVLNMWELKELIALDDWSSLASIALPLLKTHGPAILQKMYQKFVPQKIQDKLQSIYQKLNLGGDSGINPIDQGISALQPYIIQSVPGVNEFNPTTTNKNFSEQLFPVSQILTFINPLRYAFRIQQLYPKKTAITSTTIAQNITTDANGVAVTLIKPYTNNIMQLAAGTISISAGTFTTSTYVQSPMFSNATSVAKYSCTGCQVDVIFTTSSNSNGAVYITQVDQAQQLTTNFLPLGSIGSAPLNVEGNSYVNYRYVFPYNVQSGQYYTPTTDNSDTLLQVIMSGFPVSSIIASIKVTPVFEFIPTATASSICYVDYPTPGAQIDEILRTIWAQFPVLQTLSQKEADKIGNAFQKNQLIDYTNFLTGISKSLEGISQKTSQYISAPIKEEDNEDSFMQ